MPKSIKLRYVGPESATLPDGKTVKKGRSIEVDRATARILLRSPGVEDAKDLKWVLVKEKE